QRMGDAVSVFLTGMTLWQAVMGGAAHYGMADSVPAAAIAPILGWPRLDMGRFYELEAFAQPGMLVCVSSPIDRDALDLYAAAATEDGYHHINDLIDVDWSWGERVEADGDEDEDSDDA
ncbi:MAG TPA: hypothetical protein VD886_05070, partial [Herpetosiphonaceae bacterium]|nr:hypothetical protein [Herpetosiphonaceae bacterium]